MIARRSSLFLIVFAGSSLLIAQTPAFRTMEANDTFIKESLTRLSSKASAAQIRDVQDKADIWRRTKSNADLIAVTEAIYGAAKNSDVKSDVRISSSRGTGATVKYQTLGQRQRNEPPTTAKNPTEVTESMYLGMYHIWSERDGDTTSDKDAQFNISNAKERIMLQEKL